MPQSMLDLYRALLGGEENLPKQEYRPALTEEELSAAAPDASLSPFGAIDERTYDTFFGPPYNNRNLELVADEQDERESDIEEPEPADCARDSKPSVPFYSRHQSSPRAPFGAHHTSPKTEETRTNEHSPEPYGLDERFGEAAPLGIKFAPIVAVSKFPYKFVAKNISELVAGKFFNAGKFWERNWDLYYVWSTYADFGKPVLFIPEHQFTSLVAEIDSVFPSHTIKIPGNAEDTGLVCDFPEHPDLRPRWLGSSQTRFQYDFLESKAHLFEVMRANHPPDARSVETYRVMVEAAMDASKNKSKAQKARKKEERITKQVDMSRQFLRAQRYLGLLPKREPVQENHSFFASSVPVDVSLPAPYIMESDVVFIAVDVEAWERDHNTITEIGVATLDTRDLQNIPPGEKASNWIAKIQARHFLVKEYQHLKNKDFVQGCPDKFEFGTSEVIALQDAPSKVADCFKPEKPGGQSALDDLAASWNASVVGAVPSGKRSIIFLGHDSNADLQYLRKLGYNPMNLPNLNEVLDTAPMFRAYSKGAMSSSVSLGNVLYDLGLEGWYLHNAGNDAVYTMRAMLAMCVRDAEERAGAKAEERAAERARIVDKKVQAAKEEAEERVLEDTEGWSHDEGEDGGVAVKMAGVRISETQPRNNGQTPGRTTRESGSSNGSGKRDEGQVLPRQYDGSFEFSKKGNRDGKAGVGRGRGGLRTQTQKQSSMNGFQLTMFRPGGQLNTVQPDGNSPKVSQAIYVPNVAGVNSEDDVRAVFADDDARKIIRIEKTLKGFFIAHFSSAEEMQDVLKRNRGGKIRISELRTEGTRKFAKNTGAGRGSRGGGHGGGHGRGMSG